MRGLRGFTLIELMIVVAIVAIIAAISVPMFAQAIARSESGTTKGSLGALRTAIGLYTSAQEGVPPATLEDLVPQYMPRLPTTYTPGYHAPSANTDVAVSYTMNQGDPCINLNPESYPPGGGWLFRFPNAGVTWNGVFSGYCWPASVVVNCSHQDERGMVWGDY